jgi:hypothetical protein
MSKIEKNTHIKIAIKLTKTNISNKAMKIKVMKIKAMKIKAMKIKAMKIKATKHKKRDKNGKKYTYKIAMKHTKRDT